jgi:hypothetical protein
VQVRDVDLFQRALALPNSWFVAKSVFEVERRRLDLYLDFEVRGTFVCPECGGARIQGHPGHLFRSNPATLGAK